MNEVLNQNPNENTQKSNLFQIQNYSKINV
jgi:hypothetical protein